MSYCHNILSDLTGIQVVVSTLPTHAEQGGTTSITHP